MTNFHFLSEWPEISYECIKAEQNVLAEPRFAAILCRSALEKIVHWLYEHDSDLEKTYDTSLSSLIHAYSFRANINEQLFREINLIRKIGNTGAHGKRVTEQSALICIKALHSFAAFLAKYYGENVYNIQGFDEAALQVKESIQIEATLETDSLKQQLEALQKQLQQQEDAFRKEQRELQQKIKFSEEEKEKLRAAQQPTTNRRAKRQSELNFETAVPKNIPEALTRQLYIDILLKEAGWTELRKKYEVEYPVQGLPSSVSKTGRGFADYVLWGNDGKPLAVIEAKKTMIAAETGRRQAELYADCLEQEKGQRPIIYYTNGFETYIWDDRFAIPRQIQGFYTKDELQLMVDRRQSRKDLRTYNINKEIAGRPYQLEAVQRIAERFVGENKGQLQGRHRRGLLVMATGSGKTRTAASIIDMFTKSNWAKRVLFLADRNALVTQAKKSITSLLPELTSIDLTKEEEDNGTRLVFSTYPTMMNKIDSVRSKDERFYGVGHFDLIFVDEAHRSVYQKYKAIFDYFDAMVVGLTATPKTDVDHNTYELFDIEDDNPTFAYELNEAVRDGFLVPPKGISVPLKFPRQGIKYKDLKPEEQEQYELLFGDPESDEDGIERGALHEWLFNTDTVDKVLDHLMTNGIKTLGGDYLGKTIIFAKNHKHAVFIEERFNKNYPEYAGKFLRVIDNFEPKAQDLLDAFTYDEDHINFIPKSPQIAVSVDMMDTGVDAPRCVNLVFFKPVKSASKYWQMIGRGTRLRPNLFGPNDHKTEFLIFDFCENFEFFDEFPDGVQTRAVKSLVQRIFETKLEIATTINGAQNTTEEDEALSLQFINELHQQVAQLDQQRFQVRKEIRVVVDYAIRDKWNNLKEGDIIEIKTHLGHLLVPEDSDEIARRFDLLMLQIILANVRGIDPNRLIENVQDIGLELKRLTNVPKVAEQLPTIDKIISDSFWQGSNVQDLEEVRENIRELVKYISYDKQENVYTKFEDELDEDKINTRELVPQYESLPAYKSRVERYIREHQDHLVIHKLTHNIPITPEELKQLEDILFNEDLCGTKEEYQENYGDEPLGTFIRSILGLDLEAANTAFAEFINAPGLRADQMTFIKKIINFLTKNGRIEKAMLFEPPFTEQHQDGVIGIFDDAQATRIISIVDEVNKNGEVG